jgi:Family of unknown function (DUF6526)
MSTTPQTYQNHAKFVPLYHYVALPALLVNVFVNAYQAWQQSSLLAWWDVAIAAVLVAVALFARLFALKAQDRIIRLEERLRIRELVPTESKAAVDAFTVDQLVALRFAGDGELPVLVSTVRRDNLQQRDAIKKLVKHWRADDARL